MMRDEFTRRNVGDIKTTRSRRMMLNPLTEIVIGMFMTVGIGSGQFMMDILRDGKRRKSQQDTHETDREAGLQQTKYLHWDHDA